MLVCFTFYKLSPDKMYQHGIPYDLATPIDFLEQFPLKLVNLNSCLTFISIKMTYSMTYPRSLGSSRFFESSGCGRMVSFRWNTKKWATSNNSLYVLRLVLRTPTHVFLVLIRSRWDHSFWVRTDERHGKYGNIWKRGRLDYLYGQRYWFVRVLIFIVPSYSSLEQYRTRFTVWPIWFPLTSTGVDWRGL